VRLYLAITLVVAVLYGCSSGSESSDKQGPAPTASTAEPGNSAAHSAAQAAAEPPGDATRGHKLVEQYECHRCHEGIAEVEPIAEVRHCTMCHQRVMEGKFRGKPDNERWQKNVAHLTAVPSLAALGKRFRYDWVVGFLTNPHDLRPALEPTMPRLKMTKEQARDIATYLMEAGKSARPRTVALDGADVKRGRRLMEQKQCGTCHRMTGVAAFPDAPKTEGRETRVAVMLAPDLRYARERLDASTVVAWLLDPQSMKSGTPMPQTPMSEAEARDIAAYILQTELAPPPEKKIPELPKPLDRDVTFAEVAERVFDKTCRHCHGNPDVARGDGGPGSTGGFGFKARGLQLDSYERVQAGYLDNAGERQSLFSSDKGTPHILASLMARHAEEAGEPNPDVRGMPLGLPALPIEDIQLLVTWIAKGRPR